MIDINMCLWCKCTLSCAFLTVITFYHPAWHLNILHRHIFSHPQFESFPLKEVEQKKGKKIICLHAVWFNTLSAPCIFLTILWVNKKLKGAILMVIWINLPNIWFQVSKRGPLEGALKLNKKSPRALQLTFNLLTWKKELLWLRINFHKLRFKPNMPAY